MTEREEFEELQKEFESKLMRQSFGWADIKKNIFGGYTCIATECAWWGYQAAKATSFTLPDRMDCELHGDTVIDSHHNTFADGYNERLSDVISMNEEYANSTGSDGWKLVPVEPTTEQYGGLARDIIQWMRFTPSNDQHSQSLIEWLKNMGNEIPGW